MQAYLTIKRPSWHCMQYVWIPDTVCYMYVFLTQYAICMSSWHCMLYVCFPDTACNMYVFLTLNAICMSSWHCMYVCLPETVCHICMPSLHYTQYVCLPDTMQHVCLPDTVRNIYVFLILYTICMLGWKSMLFLSYK